MDTESLAVKKCAPCAGGVEPLKGELLCRWSNQLSPEWKVVAQHHLEREFKFKNFVDALAFVNKVGALAEAEGHHPDLLLAWGKVTVTVYTHKIGGLHPNDFILAAKIEA
jgi:4a-hydroxytetrahydrobiopterin dehydratase